MGMYFRTSRNTGVGVPWLFVPLALGVWVVFWGTYAMLLLLWWGLVAVVLALPYAWKAIRWMGWAWLWLAGYGYGRYLVWRERRSLGRRTPD